jgi:hypothetical protein
MRLYRKFGIVSALVLCLGGVSLTLAQQADKGNAKGGDAPAEYELAVGNTAYDVALDQPFTIKTPAGEEVQVVLHHKKVVKFDRYGIKFSYPSAMKISVEESIGVATITLNTTDTTLALVQVYTVPISDAELSSALLQGLASQIKSNGFKSAAVAPQPVKRQIGGAARTGKLVTWKLGTTTLRDEIYIIHKGANKIALLLQNSSDEVKSANEMFTVLVNSLE